MKAQNDLARYKQLIDKQEISQQQYDQAVADAKASAATVEAARASADAAKAQIEQAQGKLLQANADLRTAQTAPQTMQVTRSRAAIGGSQRPAEESANSTRRSSICNTPRSSRP